MKTQLCHQEMDVATAAETLREANNVVIVPGYGMAVANAQHTVCTLSTLLKDKVGGCTVTFTVYVHVLVYMRCARCSRTRFVWRRGFQVHQQQHPGASA